MLPVLLVKIKHFSQDTLLFVFSCHNKNTQHVSGHVSLTTSKSSLVTESQCFLSASGGTHTSSPGTFKQGKIHSSAVPQKEETE